MYIVQLYITLHTVWRGGGGGNITSQYTKVLCMYLDSDENSKEVVIPREIINKVNKCRFIAAQTC